MKLFRILFAFDALAFVGLLYFFVDGLRTFTPGSGYLGTWLWVLGIPAAAMALAWSFRQKGRVTAANVVLGLLAAPFVLYGLFAGLFVLLDPDMK